MWRLVRDRNPELSSKDTVLDQLQFERVDGRLVASESDTYGAVGASTYMQEYRFSLSWRSMYMDASASGKPAAIIAPRTEGELSLALSLPRK